MSTRIIKINRGDSYDFTIKIPEKTDPTKHYILTANDALYFALMYPNQRFEDAIFIKGYTHDEQDMDTGEITIEVVPNDTRSLATGVYYYVVKLKRGGNLVDLEAFDEPTEVRTIIERTKFIINE